MVNLRKIHQINTRLCWTACLEMVIRFELNDASVHSQPFQKEILNQYFLLVNKNGTLSGNQRIALSEQKFLDNFCSTRDGGYPTLSRSQLFYKMLLSKFGIESTQEVRNDLMPFDFYSFEITNNRPAILGIEYPMVDIVRHAVVLIDVAKTLGKKYLCVADPYSIPTGNSINPSNLCAELPCITAILDFDNLVRINNMIETTHTFEIHKNSISSVVINPFMNHIISSDVSKLNIEEIIIEVKQLLQVDNCLDVNPDNLMYRRTIISSTSISLFQFLKGISNADDKYYISPIFDGNLQKLEIMLENSSDDQQHISRYFFLGLRESYFKNLAQLNSVFISEANNFEFILDHNLINYKLLDINPIGVRLIKIKHILKVYYIPGEDYLTLDLNLGKAYTFEEISLRMNNIYPYYSNNQ